MHRTLSALMLAAILLGGCAAYERDSERRTAGQVTDDLAIQTIVKTRLVDDQQVRGLRINTQVDRGVVTLYGRVGSEAERARAVALARDVRGVVEVQDRLVLVPD
jgi:hyperosmotically inducible periplasmic protein